MVWMVVALIVIAGVGVPVAGWWLTRRSQPRDTGDRRYGQIDRWLAEQFGLGWRDRSRVRDAVLAGRPVSSPALQAAACRLAAEVMTGRFRELRVARAVGRLQLAAGPVYAAFGVVVLVSARQDGQRAVGIFAVLNGGLMTWGGVYRTLASQRIRRTAGQILRSSGDAADSGR